MKDLELFEKRVLPSIQEKDRESSTTETLQDLIKIAKAMEPTETEAPVIVGRAFERSCGRNREKWMEKDYLKKPYGHWFAALDLTEKYDPKKPILIVSRTGLDKNEINILKRPYAIIYPEGEIIPFYEFIELRISPTQIKRSFNLFNTEWEREEISRKPSYQNYNAPPFAAYVIESIKIPINELRDNQKKIYRILEEQDKLKDKLTPLEQEMKRLEEQIESVKKPFLDRIAELSQKLCGDTLDTRFDINLDFLDWCK